MMVDFRRTILSLLVLTITLHFGYTSISDANTADNEVQRSSRGDGLLSDVVNLLVKHSLERKQLIDENIKIKQTLDDVLGKIKGLNQVVEEMKKSSTNGGIYTVWGRKACPMNNTLIYTGMTGGGNYNHPGSSVEPVCLPFDPVFGSRTAKSLSDYLHGSEYVHDDFYGPGTADHDVPCAVCNSRGSQVLMIPGRNKCYNGWNEEYHGYLGSNHYSQKRGSKLTCIHEIPEFVGGGIANKDGYVFHGVLVACGSLKCPPYIQNKPVTCVVCSR